MEDEFMMVAHPVEGEKRVIDCIELGSVCKNGNMIQLNSHAFDEHCFRERLQREV